MLTFNHMTGSIRLGMLTACLGMFQAALCGANAHASVIGQENFESGGAINLIGTTNVSVNANTSPGDVFAIVGPGISMPFDVADDTVNLVSSGGGGGSFPPDTLGIAGQATSRFFAMNDADGLGGLNDATWTFDISSATSLTSINMSIAAMGDFEAGSTDGFRVDARIDGNAFQTIFLGRTNEAISHTYRALDGGLVSTLNDPLEIFIDGSPTSFAVLDKSDATTGDFDSYTSTLLAGGSGSTLDVRISWDGTPSGGEPMGFDNIVINGVAAVPEPSAFLFGSVVCGIFGVRYYRRAR